MHKLCKLVERVNWVLIYENSMWDRSRKGNLDRIRLIVSESEPRTNE